MRPKIISTFLYARKYEHQVLKAKLNCEYEIVDEFIGIESAFDLHGNPKPLCLNEVISHSDFDPFRDKLTILSCKKNLYPSGPYDEQNNLLCEFNSRAYCWDYIKSKYNDDDWVLMQDADEMLDFSHSQRRQILMDYFNNYQEGIQIFNQRMWWDWDNIAIYQKFIPCHKIGALKERERPFDHRNRHCKMLNPDIVCAFEYSHCFDSPSNWVKVTTSAHDKYTEEVMNNAYRYNTWHKSPQRNEHLQYPLDFFETIELNESNSPKFVLDNIAKLKVNTIDPAYAENRVCYLNLPYPHPLEQHGLLNGNKIQRSYHYFRRNK